MNLARIYAIRDTVSQAAQEQRVPPGWEEVTLIAPKELIGEFRERIAEAQARMRSAADTDRGEARDATATRGHAKKQDGSVQGAAARNRRR